MKKKIISITELVLLLILFVFSEVNSQTQSERYFSQMPSSETILNDIKADSEKETTAKQAGAFYILQFIIGRIDGNGFNKFTPEEKILFDSYNEGMSSVSPKGKVDYDWNKRWMHYQYDDELEKEIFNKYFSKDMQKFLYKGSVQELNIRVEKERKENRIREQYNQEQKSFGTKVTIIIISYFVFFFASFFGAWFLARISLKGKRELDSTNPFKINIRNSFSTIYYEYGTVMSPTTDREVRTVVSGDYRTGVRSSSRTITHTQFFIKKADGSETPIHLTNIDLPLRDGQKLTSLWAISSGASSGPYFLFRNHTTNQLIYGEHSLAEILRLQSTEIAAIAWTLSIPFMFLPMIVYYLVRSGIKSKYIFNFKQQINEKILPIIDKQT